MGLLKQAEYPQDHAERCNHANSDFPLLLVKSGLISSHEGPSPFIVSVAFGRQCLGLAGGAASKKLLGFPFLKSRALDITLNLLDARLWHAPIATTHRML